MFPDAVTHPAMYPRPRRGQHPRGVAARVEPEHQALELPAAIAAIRTRRAEGESIRAIAKGLQVSATTVQKVLPVSA
jgi:hypothetical protein